MKAMSTNRLMGGIITTGSICVLLACIAVLSHGTGTPLTNLYRAPLTELSSAGFHAQRFAGMAAETVTSYYEDNSALMSYGGGALMLVGLMLRTSRSM